MRTSDKREYKKIISAIRENEEMPEKLISLKEATKIFGYHQDYLSWLIRQGKIKGQRIGRNWFTTKEAVQAYFSTKEFLPLKDFLFSQITQKITQKTIWFSILVAILVGVATFLIFQPGAEEFSQGNNLKPETQTTQEVKIITHYSPDLNKEGEVSAVEKSDFPISKKETPLFQRAKNFLEKLLF